MVSLVSVHQTIDTQLNGSDSRLPEEKPEVTQMNT